jgi:hypothetical protein
MANAYLERLTADYDQHGRQSIAVAELDCEVYWTPVTVAERAKIVARVNEGNASEATVYAVILKAEDAEGKKMFSLEDKQTLMRRVRASVIEKIASAILTEPSLEALEKN